MKEQQPQPLYWEDGTVKSTGNAFTDHGYVPGAPCKVVPIKRYGRRGKGGFGSKGGTMMGLGPAKFNLTIKQRA